MEDSQQLQRQQSEILTLKHENEKLRRRISLLIEQKQVEASCPSETSTKFVSASTNTNGTEPGTETVNLLVNHADEKNDSSVSKGSLEIDDEEACSFWIQNHSEPQGDSNSSSNSIPPSPFNPLFVDRAVWLVGLLIVQSFSGFILGNNHELIKRHPAIVYFLTMLVGAGGNAGNQASVQMIRGLAVGYVNENNKYTIIRREVKMALGLSIILSLVGFVRATIFKTPVPETIAVVTSLSVIVFISVCLGSLLPLLLTHLGLDPAHSSTSIQVIMDIFGVFLTVAVSSILLESEAGKTIIQDLWGAGDLAVDMDSSIVSQ